MSLSGPYLGLLSTLGDQARPTSARYLQQAMLTRAEVLLVAVAAGHVLLAPYTKVEESFSLHAARDILALGVSPAAVAQVSSDPHPLARG